MEANQGTASWFADRLGKATASRIKDATAKGRGGKNWAASRANYKAELVTERLTGKPYEGFQQTAAMAWGTEQEKYARSAYEDRTGELVKEVGFIDHPTIKLSGASPDGLVGTGGIEIKAPNTKTHIETLMAQRIPTQYEKQMFWQMACAELEWVDFVSFDPRLPEGLQYWSQRLMRDDAIITGLETEVGLFLDEVSELEAQLRGLMDGI